MPFNKDDYIKTILNAILATTGDAFQKECSAVLDFYYKQKGLKFEKVGAAGGDFKNDGWVESHSIYYQMYSPEQFSGSFVDNLYSKFEDDFSSLCEYVYKDYKWSKRINKFYFLVNTRQNDIPRDENRRVNAKKVEMENKYGVSFDNVEVVNKDYLIELLNELNVDQLDDLLSIMGLRGSFELMSKTPSEFVSFFNLLSNAIIDSHFLSSPCGDFAKIPDGEKIRINDLGNYEEKINRICAHLGVVDEAVNNYLMNDSNGQKFQSIIDLYVSTYLDLKNNYSGICLYDEMINTLSVYIDDDIYKSTIEVFLVYVFDRCDIFEKEEYDIAQ